MSPTIVTQHRNRADCTPSPRASISSTWATSASFYDHFGLEGRDSLPGIEELRAAGLLETRSAIAVLGAQAMAATAPRQDEDEAGDDDLDEEALARSVAGEALEDEEGDAEEPRSGTGAVDA